MKFTKSGGQTAVGPQDWFTGTVYIDGIRNPDDQSAVGCAHVRSPQASRTNSTGTARPPTGSWPTSRSRKRTNKVRS